MLYGSRARIVRQLPARSLRRGITLEEELLSRHPADAITLGENDPGQRDDAEVPHRGFHRTGVVKPRFANRLPGGRVHVSPWVGETPDGVPHEFAEIRSAPANFGGQPVASDAG